MTKRGFLFWIFTILLTFILQITFAEYISVLGTFPNLLLLATVFFSIYEGPMVGEVTGFMTGLLSDISSISLFGSQTFMLTLIGYTTGMLRGKINEEKPSAQMALVFIMSLVYVLGLYFLESLFGGSAERFKVITSFFEPVYSTLVSPLFFAILARAVLR